MPADLGDTTNPQLLVPGSPSMVRDSARTLTTMGNSLIQAGEGLRGLDTGAWRGPAADAFHEHFDGEPARWLRCGDAFHDAARALNTYADVFDWAQRQAEDASYVWEHGKKLSEQALAAYRVNMAKVEDEARRTGGSPPSIPFDDPGQELRDAANSQLDRARQQLYEAGEIARSLVADARDQAPPAPTWLQQTGDYLTEIGKGARAGATELASFVGTVSPTRLITDPGQYGQDMGNLARGLGAAVTNPMGFAKTVVDWDTWQRNPGRAMGKLVPDLALTLASGGLGAVARGARSGKAVERAVNEDGTPAGSAIAGRDLAVSLATQSQMTEKGAAMAGAGTDKFLRDAPRLAAEHGGAPEEWIKKSSSGYTDKEGRTFETHWYEHGPTGNRVEFKYKFPKE